MRHVMLVTGTKGFLNRYIFRLFPMVCCVMALGSVDSIAQVREQGVVDAVASGLLAGVARANINPPVGIAHMNWGSATHIESIGLDPAGMTATAIVLSDGDDRVSIVSIDHVSAAPFRGAVSRAAKATGINPDNIILNASHTHASPAVDIRKGPVGIDLNPYVDEVERHFSVVEDKIVGAIVEANKNLVAAHMYGGRGRGTININRRFRAREGNQPAVGRNPDEFVDDELVVYRIDNAEGKPLAILTNFQAHGTALAWANKHVSPDWIGGLRQTVEAAFPGAYSLFLQGAAGDQAPVEGYTGDLEVTHRLGRILGHQVAAIATQIETVRREPVFEGYVQSMAIQAKEYWRVLGPRSVDIATVTSVIDLPARTYSKQEVADISQRLEAAQLALAAAPDDGWSQTQAAAKVRRLRNLHRVWSSKEVRQPIRIKMHAVNIGELALVSIPGEAFSKIGVGVKQSSPFDFTMFLGYSGEAGGSYLPTSEEYQYGGYETELSDFDPGADELVIARGTELLGRLQEVR